MSTEAKAPHPFRHLHHVCIVVHDLEKAVAWYEQHGMGPWFDYPKGTPYVEFEVPNREASDAMRYKCLDLDNVQLQLCQPSALDSPQRRFLDTHGEGVYHLGFEVPDRDRAEAGARGLGLAVTARGKRADGSGFAYFDTRSGAGVVLEVRNTQAAQRPAAAGGTIAARKEGKT
jgi:catechol 2,3-dioxygenase-like lactoylglutathione lyase family enzyme